MKYQYPLFIIVFMIILSFGQACALFKKQKKDSWSVPEKPSPPIHGSRSHGSPTKSSKGATPKAQQKILIYPKFGTYTMKKGDSMYALSAKYNVPLKRLLQDNPHIKDTANIPIGTQIRIPLNWQEIDQQTVKLTRQEKQNIVETHVKPKEVKWEESLQIDQRAKDLWHNWPIDTGVILQEYKSKNSLTHDALIFAAPAQTPVYSVDSGTVLFAGDNETLEKLVIIEHKNHRLSLYGHLENLGVKNGDIVQENQKIAEISSKSTTFPQLYFQVREGRESVNPHLYLP